MRSEPLDLQCPEFGHTIDLIGGALRTGTQNTRKFQTRGGKILSMRNVNLKLILTVRTIFAKETAFVCLVQTA